MNIILNGQPFTVPDGATIASLIAMRSASGHIKTTAYAVERNKELIPRPAHESTPLRPNDQIEVVVLVGGG